LFSDYLSDDAIQNQVARLRERVARGNPEPRNTSLRRARPLAASVSVAGDAAIQSFAFVFAFVFTDH